MMTITQFIFWFSLFMIFYAYFGYPMILWVIALFKSAPRPERRAPFAPQVSLLISAYNEEGVIEAKIQNALALDYPNELLEIVVVSDGSNDRTDEIVARYAD
ncbi:MAG TPA: glycosyltransferase, partial [Candidatus Manganitrophaceae bacterium]|nr:glycosyltransferase [Candidatus Manganitrophaceae bacterium]